MSKQRKGENHPMYGIKGENNPNSIKIICLNTKKTFDSISEASDYYKIYSGEISRCCSGIYNQIKGLNFMYYHNYIKSDDNEIEIKISNSNANKNNAKKIICLTTNKIFESSINAMKFYRMSSNSGIIKCCKGKAKYSGQLEDGTKLQWSYA